jgi:lipopolysaccharide biosynthesis glycosyltransferase
MDIVCATDGNYLPHCAAMLQSLLAHGERDRLRVFLIIDNVSQKVFTEAASYLYGLLPSLSILRADPEAVQGFPVNGHATVATYFRLLLPDLLPQGVKRVIFIDSDTIVTTSLQELWQLPMQGKAIAAVPDHWLSCREHGYVHGEYFNAGIMLIDLERWRQADLLARGRVFAKANPERLRHWDQDVLNHVFKDDWLTIEERWNACPHLYGLNGDYDLSPDRLTASEQVAIVNPAIIHFAGPGPVKPWNARCNHPLKHLYLAAKAQTPWADVPLDAMPPPRFIQLWQQSVFRAKCRLRRMIPNG